MQHYGSRPRLSRLDPNARALDPPSRKKRPEGRRLAEEILSPRLSPRGDGEGESGPQSCQEAKPYRQEINEYLGRLALRNVWPTKENVLEGQSELSPTMRSMLVDWLVDLHQKFKLSPESLFLTVKLIDRVLLKESVPRDRFQLLGVTALLVASKYEDVCAPLAKDLAYMTNYSSSKEDILQEEMTILSVVGFDFSYTSPLHFLMEEAERSKLDRPTVMLARYLLELALLQLGLLEFSSSELGQVAAYLSARLLKKRTPDFEFERGNSCLHRMFEMAVKEPDAKFTAVRRKFASAAYDKISEIYFQIPQ